MSNDELQKAIDDITNSAPAAAPAVDAAAENEQLANELAAPEAPAPEAAAPEFAAAPAPTVPETPGMPPVAGEAVAPEMTEAVAPTAPAAETAPVEAPAEAAPEIKLNDSLAAEAPAGDEDTLNEAYKALYPLLDKVEMPVEEKFDITMKFGEPAKALELAKQIADDTSKANALMKLIEKLK